MKVSTIREFAKSKLLRHVPDDGKCEILFILVPGLFGNELYCETRPKENKQMRVYPPPYSIVLCHKMNSLIRRVRGTQSQWEQMMDQMINPKTKLVPGKSIKSYFGHYIYKPLYDLILCDIGKHRRVDLLEFTYDWRKPLIQVCYELRNYLQTKCALIEYKQSEIVLIGHSLGGYVIRLLVESSHFSGFNGIERITKCIYASTPLFGQQRLFQLFEKIHELQNTNYTSPILSLEEKIFSNTVIDEIRVQQLREQLYDMLRENEFFDKPQLIDFLCNFKQSLALLIRHDEMKSVSLEWLCNVLEIDINYAYFIFRTTESLATLERKRDSILYICCYNIHVDEIRKRYINDNSPFYTVDEMEQMNKCRNFIQIRDMSTRLDHAKIFCSPYVLKHLKAILLQQ